MFLVALARLIYTVKVFDVTLSRKSGDNIFERLKEVLRILETWLVIVIAVCSDAGPDASRARRLLLRVHPEIVSLDCYAHQLNLIVGTYLKMRGVWYIMHAKDADDLIAWLRSKILLHATLKARHAGMSPKGVGLSVLRAVLTRWTSHYLAYCRLWDLRLALQSVVEGDEGLPEARKCVIIGDAKAKAKARTMVSLIKSHNFWNAIAEIIRHLRPLAIASNISQASHTRPDEILLIFGLLYMRFSELTSPEDSTVRTTMLDAIESRWAKIDQDVFIATLILNPFHKLQPFQPLPALTVGGVFALMRRLWQCFYATKEEPEAPAALFTNVKDYLDGSGEYTSMMICISPLLELAKLKEEAPDPLMAWEASEHSGQPQRPLTKLATRLLSICANSASCERLFSLFGTILTKLRTRLGNKTLLSLAELKMLIRDEHVRNGEVKARVKRHFGADSDLHRSGPLPGPSTRAEPTQAQTETTGNSDIYTSDDSDDDAEAEIAGQSGSTRGEPEVTSLTPRSAAAEVAEQLRELANIDRDEEDLLVAEYTALFPQRFNVRMADLINFSDSRWASLCEVVATKGLASELELCELLEATTDTTTLPSDFDLLGELDSTCEAILTS